MRALLGLGLNFNIRPIGSSLASFDLTRFLKDFDRRCMFSAAPPDKDTAIFGPPALYKTNPDWMPDLPRSPDLLQRRSNFECHIRLLFAGMKRRHNLSYQSNLLPNQEAALKWLQLQNNISILSADKNLGPVVMERSKYIKLAFKDHLSDAATYRRLTEDEVTVKLRWTHQRIQFFLEANKKSLRKSDFNFIERSTQENVGNPSFMYLLAKIHKEPLKTRAIISSSGSLCSGIAKWLSVELKKIISRMKYVATSSAQVVKELRNLNFSEHTMLFTMDAVSMYTNIHVGHALPVILEFLREHPIGKAIVRGTDINLGQLEFVIDLVMNNNVFQFGDTFWLQLAGTAMGTPPAPDYATLYFAIFELSLIERYPEIFYYRRYIDDGFGAWEPNPRFSELEDVARFDLFKSDVNSFGMNHEFFSNDNPLRPLRWTFSDRAKNVIFLDLNITIRNQSSIHTKIYEKKLNLYLYLPQHSCHSPGCLKGLIFGFAVRAKNLCTDPSDRMPFIRKSYARLLKRGYSKSKIRPIFLSAISKVLHNNEPREPRARADPNLPGPLYLHLKYNPSDPTPHEMQSVFKNMIVEPEDRLHISQVNTFNQFDGKTDFDSAIVCYSSQKNLGAILSPRKHRFGDDFSVSNFYSTHIAPDED